MMRLPAWSSLSPRRRFSQGEGRPRRLVYPLLGLVLAQAVPLALLGMRAAEDGLWPSWYWPSLTASMLLARPSMVDRRTILHTSLHS